MSIYNPSNQNYSSWWYGTISLRWPSSTPVHTVVASLSSNMAGNPLEMDISMGTSTIILEIFLSNCQRLLMETTHFKLTQVMELPQKAFGRWQFFFRPNGAVSICPKMKDNLDADDDGLWFPKVTTKQSLIVASHESLWKRLNISFLRVLETCLTLDVLHSYLDLQTSPQKNAIALGQALFSVVSSCGCLKIHIFVAYSPIFVR